jgi:putative SOS response-associated peptidase YedK
MCGRYVIFSPCNISQESFAVNFTDEDLTPNYNVCPTQRVPAILNHNGKNILTKMQWGLVPSWAEDKSVAVKMINARVETVSEKPSFKSALKKRRCLIPANGYYEWLRHESRMCDCLAKSSGQTCRPIGSTLRGVAMR